MIRDMPFLNLVLFLELGHKIFRNRIEPFIGENSKVPSNEGMKINLCKLSN